MKYILLAIGAICSLCVKAQQGYTFNRISTDDAVGLSSNTIYCTYQDEKGYIWVGTANGLQRFDGSKFVSFGSSDPRGQGLPVSDLAQILPAGQGKLWLFYRSRQEAGLLDPTSFQYQVIPIQPAGPVPARSSMRIWKDSKGELYLVISGYGMLRYNRARNSFSTENPFALPAGWKPSHTPFEDTLEKRVWIPCLDSGLAVYDITTGKVYTKSNNPLQLPLLRGGEKGALFTEFFIDSRRRHWLFSWTSGQDKYCFDEKGNPQRDTSGLGANPEYAELRSFFETRKGVLWVYGSNGLYSFDNTARRFYFYRSGDGNFNGISYQDVNHILEDRDGSIWLSTDNGLFFTNPGSGPFGVVNLQFDESKGGIEITDLLQLAGGQYWLSTWGRGIITLDKDFREYDARIYRGMPAKDPVSTAQYGQAWALYQHRDGKIWIGCQGGKYIIYDTLSRSSTFSEIKEAEGATIRYITADASGNIWISTQRGHLIRYDGMQFTVHQRIGTIIPKVLVDSKGLLWLATHNQGLYCISSDGNRVLQHYTADSKTNPLFINSGGDIDQVDDSTIAYAAGALNLVNIHTGKISWRTFEDGLPGNSIQRIRADGDGNLWIITLDGLCKYNPRTNRFTPYGRRDGINLAHLTRAADFRCSQGYIMFTGSNALMFFVPGYFSSRQSPPDVAITDFKLFNEYIPVDSLLALPRLSFSHEQNSFSIYFSALSYSLKEKLTYYYKMEGIDKDWIKADRQNLVNYPLLPPGSYTFYVYCENIDGVRSRNITHFHIYIKPPFWKTYWFLSTALFGLLLFIYFLHRMRVNRLLAVEKIRTRVARDLHDDMGSTLSTINILSSMAKNKMDSDLKKTGEYIGKISENSQQMMEAMDDIVWSIKPSNDSMQKITARMREFATSVLEAKEVELAFEVDEDVYQVKLDMEARRDFFLIFKEAVNNAAKYAKASRVTVRLTKEAGKLVLQVADNGIGFSVADADNGNGLGNMQKRTESMNGKLWIQSKPGDGTRVTLSIPLTH